MGALKGRRIVAPLLWTGGVLALSRVGVARSLLPVLGVLDGPLGVAVVALGFLAAAWEGSARLRQRLVAPDPIVLFALAFSGSSLMGVHYVSRITASGDEPHYLLMAQSLWKERDLDLRDNLSRRDYAEYFPGVLKPHYGAPRADGRPFPAHSPGLGVLLAPVFALGGRTACVVLFALLLAGLGEQVRTMALRLSNDPWTAAFAWICAVSPPTLSYSFHIYTELPSAFALALGLRLLTGTPGPWGAALAALSASCLPFLHLKMIPAAAALGATGLLRLRGRSLASFALVSLAAASGFALFYFSVFGVPTPLAVYGGGIPPDSPTSPLRAALGLLLDRSFGLLPYAPFVLLSLAGIPRMRTWRWSQSLPHAAVAAAVVLPLLNWRMWWGGQCPPARFLVPVCPFLALLAASRVAEAPRGLARSRVALVAVGLALTTYMALEPEARLMLNRGDRPTRVWASLSGRTPLGRYLPSIVADTGVERRVAGVWILGLAFLLLLDRLALREKRADALFRSLGFVFLLVLALGEGVDFWARRGEPPSPERESVRQPELPARAILCDVVGIAWCQGEFQDLLDG